MGPSKDEILRNAAKLAAEEKRRRQMELVDAKHVNLRSRMPLGCWLWVAAAIAGVIWLIHRYGGL